MATTLDPAVQERFAQIIKNNFHEDDVQSIEGCRRLVDRMVADLDGREYVRVERNPDGTIAAPAAPAEPEPVSRTTRGHR